MFQTDIKTLLVVSNHGHFRKVAMNNKQTNIKYYLLNT